MRRRSGWSRRTPGSSGASRGAFSAAAWSRTISISSAAWAFSRPSRASTRLRHALFHLCRAEDLRGDPPLSARRRRSQGQPQHQGAGGADTSGALRLEQRLGREPTLSELSRETGLEPEEIAFAETADRPGREPAARERGGRLHARAGAGRLRGGGAHGGARGAACR